VAEAKQTVVITGASRGIGEACAKELGGPDRHLVLVARGKKELERVCREVREEGGSAEPLVADLSSAAKGRRCAERLLEKVGRVDALVLNAGTSNDALFQCSTLEKVEYELGVNYLAPLALTLGLLPDMLRRGEGSIVGVGSVTSLMPFPGNATYAASKAALFTLLRTVAIEVRDRGVQVGMVLPGLTRTALTHGKSTLLPALGPQQVAEAVREVIEEGKPMVVPGLDNKLMAMLFRLFPMTLDRSVSLTARWLVPGYAQALEEGRGL
jgi:short-subunit dehydrogenase